MTKQISFTIDDKGCWNCTSHKKTDHGYAGRGKGINGNYKSLAKELYERSFGPINRPLELRHLCGNRMCINISHLTTGTRKENLADREMHGTVPRGERNPFAKLSEQQVKAIIAMKQHKTHRTATDLARIYGVTTQHIRRLWRGEKWAYLNPSSHNPSKKLLFSCRNGLCDATEHSSWACGCSCHKTKEEK